MVKLLSFEDAVNDARVHARGRPSVLLGNGFSIDYRPAIFNYDSLAEKAELAGLSVGKAVLFESLGSSNFETVIDRLKVSAALLKVYGSGNKLARAMRQDAKVVRHGLARSLASVHPDSAIELTDDEAEHAGKFLANFQSTFTVNYDLLLYWVVNKTTVPRVRRRDGFEWPDWHPSTRHVWKANPRVGAQRVFFLHGALHLFPSKGKLTKLVHGQHGRLVDELRRRLDQGKYPLVVTEGTREEKEARIDKSPYLRTALRRFSDTSGALFIHGMSLSENDDHLLEPIEAKESDITALYLGVHGHPSADADKVIRRARRIKEARSDNGGVSLRLRFYDTSTAHVWR